MLAILKLSPILAAAIFATPSGPASTFDVNLSPGLDDNFSHAAFRLYLDSPGRKDGVLVLVPGSNSDGRDYGNMGTMRAFALAHNLALVGCFWQSSDEAAINYCRADCGSGRAFEEALSKLGDESGHHELSSAPLLLWGYSAGGQFSYSFACWKPERVLVFSAMRGGIYDTPINPEAREVPAVLVSGGADTEDRIFGILSLFKDNRREGARWCYAMEPNVGHTVGRSNILVLPFFDAVFNYWKAHHARPPGFAIDLGRGKVIAAGKPPSSATDTIWFPDPSILAPWRALVVPIK